MTELKPITTNQRAFLGELLKWTGAATPRELSRAAGAGDKTRQECRRKGLAAFDGAYWRITDLGRQSFESAPDVDPHRTYNWLMAQKDCAGDDCVIWPFLLSSAGYGTFAYQNKVHKAHRFMCELTHGPQPTPRHQAAHDCGDTRCVNPRHLWWKTASENQYDRAAHGTQNVRRRKLNAQQADEIRAMYLKEDPRLTAARYGITEANVRHIQYGKTWRTDRKRPKALSDDEVREIRALYGKMNARAIAKKFGTTMGTVGNIHNNRSYRYVTATTGHTSDTSRGPDGL